MLDDLKLIASVDKKDILGEAIRQIDQLSSEFPLEKQSVPIDNVVLGGMGGSRWGAKLLLSWPGLPVPLVISHSYSIPQFANERTLFIASSFSGNTEETLSMLDHAEKANCQIAVITSGGKLLKIAKEKNYPLAKLDHSIPQPRMSIFSQIKAQLCILEAFSIIEGYSDKLVTYKQSLLKSTESFRAEVPTSKNLAKQLAENLMGKSIVIYGSSKFALLPEKYKISCNENSKNIAWFNTYPEMDHNEFIGWSKMPVDKPYAIINLLSELDHPRIQKRFVLSDKLLSGKRPAPYNIDLVGEDVLGQHLWGLMFGDFIFTYLAILNNVDPENIDLVEKLKKELNK